MKKPIIKTIKIIFKLIFGSRKGAFFAFYLSTTIVLIANCMTELKILNDFATKINPILTLFVLVGYLQREIRDEYIKSEVKAEERQNPFNEILPEKNDTF